MAGPQLTENELKALRIFASVHGRRWKSILTDTYWYNARIWRDREGDTKLGETLHGLRNRLGPTWLDRFVLPKETQNHDN